MARTWMVTGAASGLGHEIARAALGSGDTVVLTDRSVAGATDLVDEYPDTAASIELDVTDPRQITEVVTEVVERFGSVDVLVNAAGLGHYGAVADTGEKELRSLMELLFFGPAALTCAVLPHMHKQGSAAIVQISSLAGLSSSPGLSTYTAGKFALEGFEALTHVVNEFGIKVLVANPGAIGTSFGGAALVAAAILRVLADDSTPLRLALGPDALEVLGAAAANQEDERVTWQSVSRSTVIAA